MRLGQLVVDVAPLRASRDFRAVFAARVVSLLSVGLMGATVGMQVFALTGSSLHVGLVSACLAGPMIVGLLVGGVLADRLDRRRMMVATRGAYVLVVAGFLANAAMAQPRLWPIYALAFVGGAINGLSAPPLLAAVPALVGREHVVAAGALTAVATQVGAVVGPSLAGAVVGAGGFTTSYSVILGGALLVPLLLARVRALPAAERTGPPAPGVHALAEAARFVRGNPLVIGLLLIDVAATVFAMPQALFPELGARRFGGGASTVGLLYAAPGAGALLGALASGWTGRVARPGVALIGAVALWGTATTAFGLATSLPLALALLALAGVGSSASEILRRGLLQSHTPDGLQGRVGSLWMMQAIAGPAVGNVNAGLLARPLAAGGAVVLGGVLCLAGTAVVAAISPALWRATRLPRGGTAPPSTPTTPELASPPVTAPATASPAALALPPVRS